MDDDTALIQLEDLAHKLGVRIRYVKKSEEEEFEITGGFCRLKGEGMIILPSGATVKNKIKILVDCLRDYDLDPVYIRPALRAMLEKRG